MLRKAFYIAMLGLKQFMTPGSLIYLLIAPLLFTFVIGQATVRSGDETALEPMSVAVANQDAGSLGEHLSRQMEADARLAVRLVPEETALAQVADKQATAALIIPANLSETLLAGGTARLSFRVAEADERAQLVEQAIDAAAGRLIGSLQASQVAAQVAMDLGLLEAGDAAGQQRYLDASLASAQARWAAPLPVGLQVTQVIRSDEGQVAPEGMNQASPGMLAMFSLFAFLGGATVIVVERQEGTLARLLTTSVSKGSIMLGKLIGIFVTGVAQIVLLILAGVFLFGVSWGRSPAALALVVLSFALAATSLGVLLAAIARTMAQATALDNIIVLSFSALGGAWWPLEIVPRWMRAVAHAVPTAWAMDAFHDIITRGLGVEAVLPEVGALVGFAVLFFAIGIWRFRYE